jgi:hypothetical protein
VREAAAQPAARGWCSRDGSRRSGPGLRRASWDMRARRCALERRGDALLIIAAGGWDPGGAWRTAALFAVCLSGRPRSRVLSAPAIQHDIHQVHPQQQAPQSRQPRHLAAPVGSTWTQAAGLAAHLWGFIPAAPAPPPPRLPGALWAPLHARCASRRGEVAELAWSTSAPSAGRCAPPPAAALAPGAGPLQHAPAAHRAARLSQGQQQVALRRRRPTRRGPGCTAAASHPQAGVSA